MNRKELYQEIGNIDDDLVQEASSAYGKKYNLLSLCRIAGIAACLCLICSGILSVMRRDVIYFNETAVPIVSKIIVPTGENIQVVPMGCQDILDYYGIKKLPDDLGEGLIREEQSYFALYQECSGDIVYDTNTFYYSSIDSSRTLSVTLAKAGKSPNNSHKDVKLSTIDNVSILLTVSLNNEKYTAYRAEFEIRDVSVRIISDSLDKDMFINVIKEFIQFLK